MHELRVCARRISMAPRLRAGRKGEGAGACYLRPWYLPVGVEGSATAWAARAGWKPRAPLMRTSTTMAPQLCALERAGAKQKCMPTEDKGDVEPVQAVQLAAGERIGEAWRCLECKGEIRMSEVTRGDAAYTAPGQPNWRRPTSGAAEQSKESHDRSAYIVPHTPPADHTQHSGCALGEDPKARARYSHAPCTPLALARAASGSE